LRPLLVLVDVDGTLFLTDDELAGRAFGETLAERFEVELPDDAVERVDHRGQTTLRIARLVLEQAGIAEPSGLGPWCDRFAQRYLELLHGADTSAWEAAPGAERALERLEEAGMHLALLTGNPEAMARARMERLGLERFFPPSQGAFGCEAEGRTELIRLARARAGDWPAEATVELGDTPRDARSAAEAGIGSILVDESGLEGAVSRLLASAA
jgi:phosphoglycolate phosphatase